jgi:hypothetical protein
MKNTKLAIAIPTYNRAEILKENLLYMFDDIKKYSIPIYISDDSTNQDTELMISELKKNYEYIYYYKNEPALGHDKNCFATLQLPEEEYIWYLGDSVMVKQDTIKTVLKILENEHIDFLFINEKSRKLDEASGIYDDKNKILLKFGWHLTQTGATIYSKKSLLNIANIELNKVKNFPQFVLIFKSLQEKFQIYWMNEKNISINSKKKSYWNSKVFEVFIDDWTRAVMYLQGDYEGTSLEQCILNHSKYTQIFSFKTLINLRANGSFNNNIYKKYKQILKKHSYLPSFIIHGIKILPTVPLQHIKTYLKELKK